MTSFRAGKGSYSSTFFPDKLTLNNYVSLFTDTDVFNFPQWFLNTLVVAIFSCILSTFFIVSIAYVTSRLRFKSRKLLLNVALVLGMFPGFMAMIAIYYILKGIGMTQGVLKLVSLVLVYAGRLRYPAVLCGEGIFRYDPRAASMRQRILTEPRNGMCSGGSRSHYQSPLLCIRC